MTSGEEVVDLARRPEFVSHYVELRNQYVDLLVSSPVTFASTVEWLKRDDVEVRGILKDGVLQGAVVLYLDRDGEIAFFAREPGRGIGSRLLENIEEVGKRRNLASLWAWTMERNGAARRAFEKSGFIRETDVTREYQGSRIKGMVYRKQLA